MKIWLILSALFNWSRLGQKQTLIQPTNLDVAAGFGWSWANRRHSRRHQRFAREMTSEKQVQKFHVNDASLPRSGYCFWLVVRRVKFALTNQKHYPDLSSDTSSVWNFCALSQTSFRGWRWWRREMSSVFSGSTKTSCQHAEKGEISHTFPSHTLWHLTVV